MPTIKDVGMGSFGGKCGNMTEAPVQKVLQSAPRYIDGITQRTNVSSESKGLQTQVGVCELNSNTEMHYGKLVDRDIFK